MKKAFKPLRSLSVILSAAVLAGTFPSGTQTVLAEPSEISFSPEEDSSSDAELTEEEISDDVQESSPEPDSTENPDSSQDSSPVSEDEPFSSDSEDLFSSGEASDSLD